MYCCSTAACSGPEECSPHGVCTLDERTGSKSCVCLFGFEGDGINCQHVDLQPQCPPGEECTCPPGFILETDICLPSAADTGSESESKSDIPLTPETFNANQA